MDEKELLWLDDWIKKPDAYYEKAKKKIRKQRRKEAEEKLPVFFITHKKVIIPSFLFLLGAGFQVFTL